MIQKVYAYITHKQRLLVFEHVDYPEAGVQVPGGTVKVGEGLAAAVLREAAEETGLRGFAAPRYLGADTLILDNDQGELKYRRHFFHLVYQGLAPANWRHWETEPSEGESEAIEFEFRWVELPDGVPELAGGLGVLLGDGGLLS